MKRLAAVIGILLIVATGWWFLGIAGRGRNVLDDSSSPDELSQSNYPSNAGKDGRTIATAQRSEANDNVKEAVSAQNPDLPPTVELQNVRTAIRQYGDMWGGNPVGTNPEITSVLNGNNPKQINFINTETGMRINDQGELVDPWGTPFFFHQISSSEMEVRSAGPDKKMWTADDLVVR